ncbi:MAG TPA: metal-dependent hydrolase, partial [Polyangiaceae bacterium LLY-WYZ-15_(1-7)]|nr:metal-dependent hydrolase [Polyangiaceae bacterium LLY-WYZ-15_(1-7)]
MTNPAPTTTSEPRRLPIRTRKLRLPFQTPPIPRHWHGGSPVATHLFNGVNLLFPYGERFFVRSVRHYLDAVKDDPELLADIRGFFGQEGNHAREHERYFEVLESQGYEIREFLDQFERSFAFLERRFPPVMHLAATAAAEHFTAIMARYAFQDRDFLENAHPTMRDLILWHAAEEIEHKAVAFDVLQKVAPSYPLRVAGFLLASAFLMFWWFRGVRMLLRQDGLSRAAIREDAERLGRLRDELGVGERDILRDVFLQGLRSYARPGFHPWDDDDRALVEEYVAELDAAL